MSLSTAYGMKKRMGKKMAFGGEAEEEPEGMFGMPKIGGEDSAFADGGEVADMQDADMIARIVHKRREYSKGGMVANDTGTGQEADKLPNQFDDLVLRDDLEDTAPAGNEIGDESVDDEGDDIVGKIMKSRKKK